MSHLIYCPTDCVEAEVGFVDWAAEENIPCEAGVEEICLDVGALDDVSISVEAIEASAVGIDATEVCIWVCSALA